MNKKKHGNLVPALRFSEFEGKWEKKKLDDICEINPASSSLPKEFIYIDLESVDSGRLLKRKKISLETAPSRAQRLLEKGDTIFQMVRPYQRNNFFFNPNDNLQYVASTGYAQLRAFQSEKYLYQYIHNDDFVNRVLAKCTGSNYPAINSRDLAKIKVVIPENPQEQQKIATTLTTLDNLIAAEKEKGDALQAHKKGLLQQLFPAKGERVPRVRFGEFRGAWEEKDLGNPQVSYLVTQKINRNKLTLSNYISTDNMLPDYSGITEASKLPTIARVTEFIEGDILISNIRPYLKKVWKADRKGGASNDILVFRSGSDVTSEFLEALLKNDSFINYVMKSAKGVKMPRGDKDSILSYSIRFPKRQEQQRIANCLSFLDALIAAQAEKVAALEAHKKGLMQQLFPNVK